MSWMFWRRHDIERAKAARDKAREDRADVERVADDLRKRGQKNRFAPLLVEAFQKTREN